MKSKNTAVKILLIHVCWFSFIYVHLVHAIDKINKIKEKREKLYIMRRLQRGVELRKKEDIKLVETQMHLIRAPNGKISFAYI